MENTNQFKMTYYIGSLLALGGVLNIQEDMLVFSPGALERAVGNTDTPIPYDQVNLVDVTGTITESLLIKTKDKVFRFVGSDPHEVKDRIHAAIQNFHQNRTLNPAAFSKVSVSPPRTESNVEVLKAPAPPPAQTSSTPAATPTLKGEKCPGCLKPVRPEFNFCPSCQTALKSTCLRCFKSVDSEWKFCVHCSSPLKIDL